MSEMNEPPQKPKRRWIPIVFGIVLFLFVLGVGSVIFSVAWFRQHLLVTEASETTAAQEFEAVRAKFPGQRPLLEMRDGRPFYVEERNNEPRSNAQITTLHLMAFDGDDGELVTFALPFWLLRLKSGPISFSSYASGFDDRGVSIRPEDIERHGPGLVLDFTVDRRGRVLVWAE
jgi:hypothetical protein